MAGKRIGEVSHYFDRISVAVINLTSNLAKGDKIHFLGHGSDFLQDVTSMQIEHETIDSAKKGDEVAIKVAKPVKKSTSVFLVTEE
jgi:putative protease